MGPLWIIYMIDHYLSTYFLPFLSCFPKAVGLCVMCQNYPCDSPSIVPIRSSLLTSLFTQWKTERHLPIMAASNSYHSFTPPPSAPPPTHQSVDWQRSLPGQQPLYCLSPTEQNSRQKKRQEESSPSWPWLMKERKKKERKKGKATANNTRWQLIYNRL